MVEYISDSRLDRTLAALADPTRRAILARLAEGEAKVTDIAKPYDISLNAVSKHLRVLERAGLLRREVRGREHVLFYDGGPLAEVGTWLERHRRFWSRSLDRLEDHLEGETAPDRQR